MVYEWVFPGEMLREAQCRNSEMPKNPISEIDSYSISKKECYIKLGGKVLKVWEVSGYKKTGKVYAILP
ncbi:MAG: hypothetical protein F6K40_35670 [Okeania sp. SIO3I5]|uniref:hypothetical protein n=1 Tax=Okeania sp. SIO3I5 TaxID=2607805 RepID=UPI0013BBD884|nr:hypothetical protein [Okeania sp. SIO3I5]NEQ41255.1 hypothetical protein [Okeania sp. SIO3I5]